MTARRTWSLASLLAVALACSASSSAQSGAQAQETNTIPPKTFTIPGGSEAVASGMLASMRLAQKQRDLCWEFGCLVIVNETNSYHVTGFFVADSEVGGKIRWSPNQFGAPLRPRRATFRFKSPGTNCDRAIRFVLKRPKTKEVVNIDSRAGLCATPHRDSLFRINVLRPEVTVEPGPS